ncbi:MAG: CBS domain-containing protein [Pseudomonadota bacterium]
MQINERPEFLTKPKPLTVTPDTTVADAVAQMTERNYGSVVVVDPKAKVLGIMTERDVMKRIVHEGRDAKETPVEAVMTKEPRCARDTDQVVDWLRIMSNERFRRVPIVDDEGTLKSIMTQGDFVSYTWPDLLDQAKTMVRASLGNNYQLAMIIGAIAFYTLALILILR